MQHPKYLYHYTSVLNLPYIMESRYLKLTPSNLVKPKRYWKEPHPSGTGYNIVGDTDNIKPVVWMTEEDNVQKEEAFHIGYRQSPDDRTEIKFVIPYKEKYKWWVDWKDRNRMDKKGFQSFVSHGEKYGSWWISEEMIPFEDILMIVNNHTGEVIWKNEDMEVEVQEYKKNLSRIFGRGRK